MSNLRLLPIQRNSAKYSLLIYHFLKVLESKCAGSLIKVLFRSLVSWKTQPKFAKILLADEMLTHGKPNKLISFLPWQEERPSCHMRQSKSSMNLDQKRCWCNLVSFILSRWKYKNYHRWEYSWKRKVRKLSYPILSSPADLLFTLYQPHSH